MTDLKKYTVSDLAELMNVPRTTIYDWLARYPRHTRPITRGKRKLYSQATADVIRFIAELKRSGMSPRHIENELASGKHRLSEAETAPVSTSKESPPPTNDTPSSTSPSTDPMILERLDALSDDVAELTKLNHVSRIRNDWRFTTSLVAIVVLLLVIIAAIVKIVALERALDNLRLSRDSRTDALKTPANGSQRDGNAVSQAKEAAPLKVTEKELERQRQAFDTMLERVRRQGFAEDADNAAERDRFAAERLRLLKSLPTHNPTENGKQP